jgi:hypothetical protein
MDKEFLKLLIDDLKTSKNYWIDIADLNLFVLPENFHELEHAIYIFLSNNYLLTVGEINNFVKLKELHLQNNRILFLPDLSGLKNLKVLNLRNNQLRSVPQGIEKIETLEYVFLDGNEISYHFTFKGHGVEILSSKRVLVGCKVFSVDELLKGDKPIIEFDYNELLVNLTSNDTTEFRTILKRALKTFTQVTEAN